MRAINVALCFVVSFLLAVLVAEVGLRLLGMGPQPTINRFDPDTGWSKRPDASIHKKTGEFDITIATNHFGLRDDPMTSAAKRAGTKRVLVLGDSFALGYTVDRDDLFVDLLERRWKAEGRPLDVVNTGTEGWSTDQEAVWLEKNGAQFQPDVVLLFPYENDLYWNGELAYTRFPKPRFSVTGPREMLALRDPGETPWYERTAVGRVASGMLGPKPRSWSPPGSTGQLEMEHAAYWRTPPDFMAEAIRRTRAGFASVKQTCDTIGAQLVIVPIPGKASIVPRAKETLEAQILPSGPIVSLRRSILGGTDPRTIPSLAPDTAWSPDQPVETFLALAKELSIRTVDVRDSFRARVAAADGDKEKLLYHEIDWHLNPLGNRALAEEVHTALDASGVLSGELAAQTTASMAPPREDSKFPRWVFWYVGLVVVLGTVYSRTYKDVAAWQAYAITGGMLGLVFTIAVGGSKLLSMIPPAIGRAILVLFVLGLLGFVLYKLGRRIGTITELLAAFTRRGHWYLMPLVVILLTIGSLLVVAASSPLVAPFIYTLF